MDFTQDMRVQEISQVYAANAVGFAFEHFNISLDFSDSSIDAVEFILEQMYQEWLQNEPSREVLTLLSHMFGSYVGEVYRRQHEGEWGISCKDDEVLPAMRCPQSQIVFYPWTKVQDRLEKNDEDNNIAWYYKLLSCR